MNLWLLRHWVWTMSKLDSLHPLFNFWTSQLIGYSDFLTSPTNIMFRQCLDCHGDSGMVFLPSLTRRSKHDPNHCCLPAPTALYWIAPSLPETSFVSVCFKTVAKETKERKVLPLGVGERANRETSCKGKRWKYILDHKWKSNFG